MRKLKEGMILLNVNKIFRILLLQTENTLLPFHIKVVLKSDISSQHKINVGPLRVINTYYALDTGPITIKLALIKSLRVSNKYTHVQNSTSSFLSYTQNCCITFPSTQ